MIYPIRQKSSKAVKALTAKQERAIPMVLVAKSIEEGCKLAKITKQTWFTWLKIDGFKAEVDRQRAAVVSEAMDRLKSALSDAVDGLTGLMDAEQDNIKLRACEKVLELFFRTRESEDLEARLKALEEAIGQKGAY
ncbi:MAG: hypothetical protein C0392_05775 [Syntrophus sp. (in: bacteria)]|nr:hypothetical protein [Syntrophus sp. (in: bacteria)]